MINSNRGLQTDGSEYANASKNMRNFVHGTKILQQGVINDNEQNIKNVIQIIKYLQSGKFKKELLDYVLANLPDGTGTEQTVENPFDPTTIWQNINNLWNIINNLPESEPGEPGEPGPPGKDGEDGKPGIEDFGNLYLTVNGSTTGITGTPFDPTNTADQTFNINLFDKIPENPFYPMKVQFFEANIPNGYNQYDGQVALHSDTQVVLVKKMNQNAIGIRFYNMNAALNNERVLFVHMSADSPITDNVQILFSTGTAGGSTGVNMNARLQEANLVFISRDFCMYQAIGSGGSMN